jgi:hypothetical protein
MAKQRRNPEDYPAQVVTKRGIVELQMSPASMHELLYDQLHLSADQVLKFTQERVSSDPTCETFWMLVAYIAMSGDAERSN